MVLLSYPYMTTGKTIAWTIQTFEGKGMSLLFITLSEWGRSPGEGNGNPLQYSYLENPMNRRAWQATVHGGCKNLVLEKLKAQ